MLALRFPLFVRNILWLWVATPCLCLVMAQRVANPLSLRATGIIRYSKNASAQLPDIPGPLGHTHDPHGIHQGLGSRVAVLCPVAACRKGFRIGGLFAPISSLFV